jgi:hypothetical protein
VNLLNNAQAVVVEAAVDEAISRLGYLNTNSRSFLIQSVQDGNGIHPRSLCTAHRKNGEQLSRQELNALGLRPNAFMSRTALMEITDKGRAQPLIAHEKTLLRAYFTYSRWRSLWSDARNLEPLDIDISAASWCYDMLPPVCVRCSALDGTTVMPLDAHILPPSDCDCETANYAIQLRIDWLYDLR